MVVFGKNVCIRAKLTYLGKSGFIRENWLYLGKVVVLGQIGCIWAKWL